MALQEGQIDFSQEFGALNIETDETPLPKQPNSSHTSTPLVQIQCVGRIPYFSTPKQTQSLIEKLISLVRIPIIRKSFVLTIVFCLGYLSSFMLHHRNERTHSHRELSLVDEVLEETSQELVSSGSTKVAVDFSNFDSESFSDELYSASFQVDNPIAPYSNGSDPIYDSLLESSNDQHPPFPTWADLEPREKAQDYSEPLKENNSHDESDETIIATQTDTLDDLNQISATNQDHEIPSMNNSLVERVENKRPPAPASQGFQNFQAYSTIASNTFNNENLNNNNTSNNNNVNEISPVTNYVKNIDGSLNNNYNNYYENTGNSKNTEMSDSDEIAGISSEKAYANHVEVNSARYHSEINNAIYQDRETEKPIDVASIPTFSNPRPERDNNARQAYVASRYADSEAPLSTNSPQPQPKPGRSVRW